jgi:hypothetical protein
MFVTKGCWAGLPDVKVLGEDILMGDAPNEFQVGVRDGPSRVRERD